jgi:hypothetical protein
VSSEKKSLFLINKAAETSISKPNFLSVPMLYYQQHEADALL